MSPCPVRRARAFCVLPVLVGLFILRAIAETNSTAQERVEQLWNAALQAQQAQRFDDAINLYTKILTLKPGMIEAELNLGLMYQVKGDLSHALPLFQQVLKASPHLYPPNLLAGLDYLKQGMPDRALPLLDKAVTLNPRDAKAQAGFANSNLQLQRYAVAQQHFQTAVELDPKNSDGWYGLGVTYLSIEKQVDSDFRHTRNPYRTLLVAQSELQQGRFPHAADLFQSVLQQHSEIGCTHSLLGLSYLGDGKTDMADHEFRQDWDDNTHQGCLLAKVGLGAEAARRGQTSLAIQNVREASEIDARAVRASFHWVSSYFSEAKLDHPIRQMEAAAEPPKDTLAGPPESLFNSGRYTSCTASLLTAPLKTLQLDQLGLLSRCSSYAAQDKTVLDATAAILAQRPEDAEATYWRILSLERLGLVSLANAAELKPDSVSLHMIFGNTLRSQGNFADAADEYRKAIAVQHSFIPAHLGLAQDLYWDDKRDEAETEVRIVLQANPADPEANYLLGRILLTHDPDAALEHLTIGLQISSERKPEVHAALSKAYELKGNLGQAIAELDQSLVGDEDGSYHYRLARLLEKTGDRQAAAQALQQSRRIRAQSDAATLGRSD